MTMTTPRLYPSRYWMLFTASIPPNWTPRRRRRLNRPRLGKPRRSGRAGRGTDPLGPSVGRGLRPRKRTISTSTVNVQVEAGFRLEDRAKINRRDHFLEPIVVCLVAASFDFLLVEIAV